MFPAIRTALKELWDGFNPEPVELSLKQAPFGTFDATGVGWYARNGYPNIYSILSGGAPAWSGETVSLQTALQHSVFWACNRLISETLAMLPLVMLQRKGDEKQIADDHPMYSKLHDEPNAEMTAMTFRETRTSHALLQGNGYAQILRRSGTGVAYQLRALDPGQVRPDRENAGQRRLIYLVKDGNAAEKTYTVADGKPQDILHIHGMGWDGVQGYSVLTMGRQSIGTAIAAERNVGRFWANGGRVPYNLKLSQKLKNEDFDKFRADWERVYSEPHRAPILEPWVDYQQTGLSAVDAQLLETRLFHIHEVCRWFLVSPHLVGDLSRATFSNIEQLALEFVKITLSSWITRWEQELHRSVLTDDEKNAGYFFKHNLNAVQRGDFQSRMQGYSVMLQNGIASVNEIRDLEDWNPVDGGDDHHIQLNMQSLPGGAPLTSQSAALVRLGQSSRDGRRPLTTKNGHEPFLVLEDL